MRVAVSGIPSSKMRNITGRGADFSPRYDEVTPRIASEKSVKYELSRIANTGNFLIGEGLRYAVRENESHYVPMPWLTGEGGPEVIRHLNQNFDFFAIASANLFHIKNDTSELVRVLNEINIPVLMMSAGIQKREDFNESCPESFRPFIDVVKRKNIRMFTRGAPTTDFLRSQGVNYVEPVGCPSLFAFPDNFRVSMQRLKRLKLEETLDVIYSGYLGAAKDTVLDINAFAAPGTARYVLQDEPLLFKYNFSAPENTRVYNDISGEILAPVNFPGADELRVDLKHYVFFSTEQWRAFASRSSFAFARRFHGGIIAAQAGVPTIWISVDDRTSEMLSFADLPHINASEWNHVANKKQYLTAFINDFNLQRSMRTYNVNLERFRSLLKDLGLRK